MPNYTNYSLAVVEEVKKVIIGKDDCVRKVMMAILAKGHILIEDVPGVGKTTLALTFSTAMELTQNRVQFTPDVLPSDIVGFSLYQKDTKDFLYQPGPIMCNLFLADEINRTSPKTQSALLEVMEEGKVTIDGISRSVPNPFIVMATQNPMGSAGTQKLPDSQLDRFIVRISIGYPNMEDEINIVKSRASENPFDALQPVINGEALLMLQEEVENIYVHDTIYSYIARLITATREHSMISLGLSPRATIALAKMAKANAFMANRDYVIPDDVYYVFPDVAIHRLHLDSKAKAMNFNAEDIVSEILKKTVRPSPESSAGV